MNEHTPDHPDLKALLSRVPPEEAARLGEVWAAVGADEPTAFPGDAAAEAARARLPDALPETAHRNGTARLADRRPHTLPKRRPLGRWMALAAALLVGALGLFWWMQPVMHVAPLGEQMAVELPDGSGVVLDSGARLRHARRFGAERRVVLDGEAFFDVRAAEAPFVVETFNAEVRVLGTRFGVRAWRGLEHATTVALETGRVVLTPRAAPDQAVEMAPGETRRVLGIEAVALAAPALSVDEATAWRRGDFFVKDQPVDEILHDVERRFAVDLRYDPATLGQRRLSLKITQPKDAEAVVRALATALGLQYRERTDGFAIFEAPD